MPTSEPFRHLVARLREVLAEDERTNTLEVKITVSAGKLFLVGEVTSQDLKREVERVAREIIPRDMEIVNELQVPSYGAPGPGTNHGAVRVAAVGDVHFSTEAQGSMRPHLEDIAERADVLLLAGDLTQHGYREEGAVLAGELRGLAIPIVSVLGNHDYHHGVQDLIRKDLEDAGVVVLEGESVVLELAGRRVGIAGVKGFGGGFAGACGTEFGEEEMKAFIRHTKDRAQMLEQHLAGLEVDVRIALTHYAPTKDTLGGERPEIYPFLGSYLLGKAIDDAGCEMAIHGHAHLGRERGLTPGGVPVRNVARPVLRRAYEVYCVGAVTEVTASAC